MVGILLQPFQHFLSLMQCQILTQIDGRYNILFVSLILQTEPSCELLSMFIWHQEVLSIEKLNIGLRLSARKRDIL